MKSDDPRLGLAAFFGATVLVLAALVAFARYPGLFNHGRQYRAVFANVSGLNVGDQVRYGGLLVGSVVGMEIDPRDPTRIEVEFRVKRSTPVHLDTRASITQVGLLGEPFLALLPGAPDAPMLAAGGTLPSENSLSFQEAMNMLARFFQRTDTLFAGLEKFADGKPFDRLDHTLTRVDQLVSSTATSSDRVLSRLDDASGRLGGILDRTDRLIAVLDTTARTAGPGLRDTQREALDALHEVRTLVAQLRDGLNQGGGVDEVMRNIATASDNLARLSERLERDPTSVLKKRRVPSKPAGPALRD